MAPTLESGIAISRYSIVGPIGAGGMGEVYKAQDSSLERMVAIKILPPDVVKNDERRRRFVQEARSASSLNHPHIVTIHEIGEATIQPSGDTIHYIAMELIDGVTLKRKIHQEQADVRTIVGYLAQAADGLAKAHAAGIIHRDLKPENIMVTRDGFAKVLDFGLAKLSARKSATETLDGATAVKDDTREGAILGTVAYMAPEQVMGKVVDHRCDIFSFGAILYEAATRRRPFDADSDVDVMHKILHDAPPPIDPADAKVPAELRRIIRRCLAKDPDRRYQSMKDLAIDLRELVDNYEELPLSTGSGGGSSVPALAAPEPKRNAVMWIAAGVAVLALAALAYVLLQQRKTVPVAGPAAAPMAVQRLTSSGSVSHAKISGDGRYLAMVVRDLDGRVSLRVRQIATGSEVEVAPPGERLFAGLAISPDGNYVYYSRRDEEGGTVGWLYQVPTLGGPSRKIAFNVDTAPAFSPDGKRIAYGRGMPEKQVNHYLVANADGSGERLVVSFPRFTNAILSAPAWSPDGTKLLAARLLPPGSLAAPVEIDLATGAARDIATLPFWWIFNAVYRPDGSAAILSGIREGHTIAQLWHQPLPAGEARRLTNDFIDYRAVSLTADGRSLVANSIESHGEMHTTALDDPSGGTPLGSERSTRIMALTSSGSGALVYVRVEDGAANVHLLDAPGAQPRALTTNGYNDVPSISADGRTIVYTSFSGGTAHTWMVDAEGSGRRQITDGDGEYGPSISPDGKVLLYITKDALWKRPVGGGQPVKVADRPTGSHGFSTDSRLIFYRHWSSTAPEIVMSIEPAAGGPKLIEMPSRGGRGFRFSPKNDGIVYVNRAGAADNLFLQKLDGSAAVQLTRFTRGGINSFGWDKDGKLVYIRTQPRSDALMYTGF